MKYDPAEFIERWGGAPLHSLGAPVSQEIGRLRKAFISHHPVIVQDFTELELRVAAHLTPTEKEVVR